MQSGLDLFFNYSFSSSLSLGCMVSINFFQCAWYSHVGGWRGDKSFMLKPFLKGCQGMLMLDWPRPFDMLLSQWAVKVGLGIWPTGWQVADQPGRGAGCLKLDHYGAYLGWQVTVISDFFFGPWYGCNSYGPTCFRTLAEHPIVLFLGWNADNITA